MHIRFESINGLAMAMWVLIHASDRIESLKSGRHLHIKRTISISYANWKKKQLIIPNGLHTKRLINIPYANFLPVLFSFLILINPINCYEFIQDELKTVFCFFFLRRIGRA